MTQTSYLIVNRLPRTHQRRFNPGTCGERSDSEEPPHLIGGATLCVPDKHA